MKNKTPFAVGENVFVVRRSFGGSMMSVKGPFPVTAERKYQYTRNVKVGGEWYRDNGSLANRENFYDIRIERDSPRIRELMASTQRMARWLAVISDLERRGSDIPDERIEKALPLVQEALAIVTDKEPH